MSLFILLASGVLGAAAVALLWAILSPTVRDGIFIKLGLILMCFGGGAASLLLLDGRAAGDGQGLNRALSMAGIGLVIAGAGALYRAKRRDVA